MGKAVETPYQIPLTDNYKKILQHTHIHDIIYIIRVENNQQSAKRQSEIRKSSMLLDTSLLTADNRQPKPNVLNPKVPIITGCKYFIKGCRCHPYGVL